MTGLVFNSAGLVCYYARPGEAAAQQALVTQTVTGAHTDGGFVEIDATNMPGVYRLDLKDAIFASGVDSVLIMLKGATNMVDEAIDVQLTAVDLNDNIVEAQGSYTEHQVLSLMFAALCGVTADAGATLKTPDGLVTRIAATINASNERTAMTLTPSG